MRQQLERTLTEAGGQKTFRDVVVDALNQRLRGLELHTLRLDGFFSLSADAGAGSLVTTERLIRPASSLKCSHFSWT